MPKVFFFCFLLHPNKLISYRFFGHYLPFPNIRKPTKGSKDPDFRLFVFLKKAMKLPLEFVLRSR